MKLISIRVRPCVGMESQLTKMVVFQTANDYTSENTRDDNEGDSIESEVRMGNE